MKERVVDREGGRERFILHCSISYYIIYIYIYILQFIV
jgi:hypothetical protein